MKEQTIITKEKILSAVNIKDIDEKQRCIDEFITAFADNKACFESSECWSEYYELVHGNTSLSHKLRKKAFLNAYKSQKGNGCR